MTTPERIQRKRTKGWRMPPGAVYVGRPSKWGNPFPVDIYGQDGAVDRFRRLLNGEMTAREVNRSSAYFNPSLARFRIRISVGMLRGKDLACWCPLDEPCHADVLLEWANQ